MSKHKSEDYKIAAVKYYLENDTNYKKQEDVKNSKLEKIQNHIKVVIS